MCKVQGGKLQYCTLLETRSRIGLAVLVSELPVVALCAVPNYPNYPIVATGQLKCYDNRGEISPTKPGQLFFGQDPQFRGHAASFTLAPAEY